MTASSKDKQEWKTFKQNVRENHVSAKLCQAAAAIVHGQKYQGGAQGVRTPKPIKHCWQNGTPLRRRSERASQMCEASPGYVKQRQGPAMRSASNLGGKGSGGQTATRAARGSPQEGDAKGAEKTSQDFG